MKILRSIVDKIITFTSGRHFVHNDAWEIVAVDEDLNIKVLVEPNMTNSSPRYEKTPYVTIYSSVAPAYRKAPIMRLHFKDGGMEYVRDGYPDWKPTSEDMRIVREFLGSIYWNTDHSVWKEACYLWNQAIDIIPFASKEEYFRGYFDESLRDEPYYIPSGTPIPETWTYKPPVGIYRRKSHRLVSKR